MLQLVTSVAGAIFLALFLLVLTVLLCLVIAWNLPYSRRLHRMTKDFPRQETLPLFVDIFKAQLQNGVNEEFFNIQRRLRKRFGSRFVISEIVTPTINLSGPEDIERVLNNTVHIEKGRLYNFLAPWLGQGLLTSTGALWHSRRKLLTPAFHFKILEQFSECLERKAEYFIEELEEVIALNPGQGFDIVKYISRCTLKAICETAMGCELTNENEDYFSAVRRMGAAGVYRLIRPWFWPNFTFRLSHVGKRQQKDLKILHGFTEKVIKERKTQLEKTSTDDWKMENNGEGKLKNRRPFLDMLLFEQKAGAPLTDLDIREEVDTFMFEGHDTLSMALSWALEILSRHPAEQELLAEELLDAGTDWESISKLQYLDRVVKECLRHNPSVPFIARNASADIQLVDGKVIPKHCTIHIHIYDLHRHPEHYPDPDAFTPDNFLPEKESARHPFAFLPFSAGPRNCIGRRYALMQLKILLGAIIRKFAVRPDRKAEVPKIIADLVLRPKSGIYLTLTPRTRD